MSGPHEPAGHDDFGAQYWEDRYRTGQTSGLDDPSPLLIAESSGLPPGQALEAGCGRGADAFWLASRGWQVTAVDVSITALTRAQERARAAGQNVAERIEWVHADLADWDPGGRRFDLVTSHYVHLPGPAQELFSRLAEWVAPGGTLLVVGHDSSPDVDASVHEHGHAHAHPAASQVRVEQVTASLLEGQWEVMTAESRTRLVDRPDGAGVVTLHDAVVRARRAQRPGA